MIYRLTQVEIKLDELGKKMDGQDNLKRSDLVEFKEAIFGRFAEVKKNLEDELEKKAPQSQVDDLRGLVKWAGAFGTTIIGGFIVFYLTNPR